MYKQYNPNPENLLVGDCVIRALTAVFHSSWEKIYMDLAVEGLRLHDMPSANRVWGEFLHRNRFHRHDLLNTCPDCYTVKDFCRDYPEGTYIVATGTHVIAVIDGDYFDAWDSGMEVPQYYWSEDV